MSMRVTTTQLYSRLQTDLQTALRRVADGQYQISSGKRFGVVSEDPFDGVRVLSSQRDLRALEQYRRNTSELRTRLDTQQGTIDQVLDVIDTMRDTAIQQGTATASADTRRATARDMERAIEQLVNLGNVRIGNEYLFGGLESTTAPFTFTAPGTMASTGASGRRNYEVADNTLIQGPHDGTALYDSTGVITAANALRVALDANDLPAIGAAAEQLNQAFGQVSAIQGEVGALQRSLDNNENLLDIRENLFTATRDGAWNVDVAEATVKLSEAQQALQAAMLAASKTLNTSLVDYLR